MNKFKSWKYAACLALVLCLCAALLPSVVFAAGETVLYVDGVGDGTNNRYATLKAALAAVPDNNETAYVVIQTTVDAGTDISGTKWQAYKEGFQTSTSVKLPKHSGTVIITSLDPNNQSAGVPSNVSLNLEWQHTHISGKTVFENINITATYDAFYLYADYNDLTFGAGVTGEPVTNLFLGNDNVMNDNARFGIVPGNVTFTMNSGNVTNLYGSARKLATDSGDSNIVINGGTVNTVFGAGDNGTAQTHTGNVNININGGKTATIHGASQNATLEGNVNITISDGEVENVYGANSATVNGDVNITVDAAGTGVVTENVYGAHNTATVNNINIAVTAAANKQVTGTVFGVTNSVKEVKGNVRIDMIPKEHSNAPYVYAYQNGTDTAKIKGDCIWVCRSKAWVDRAMNFNAAEIYGNMKVETASASVWAALRKVTIYENGVLNYNNVAPAHTEAVSVSIEGSQILGRNVITAPAGTADLFQIATTDYSLYYANGTSATWSIHPAIGIYNITLNEKLDANVTVNNMTSDYTVEFRVGDAAPVEAQIKAGGKYYVSLWPYEMADTVTVNLKKGTDVVDTAAVTKEAYGAFLEAQGEKYKAVWDAVLAYCDEAKQYQAETASELEFDAESLSGYAVEKDGEVEGTLILDMNLGTACEMILKYPDGYTLTTNNATIKNISVVDWGTAVTYTLTKDAATVTVTASPMSYVWVSLNKATEAEPGLHDLVWTMYNYYTAAKAL